MEENTNIIDEAIENLTPDEIIETDPSTGKSKIIIIGGLCFAAGYLTCKVAKPIMEKVKGIFQKKEVKMDDSGDFEDAEFKVVEEEASEG